MGNGHHNMIELIQRKRDGGTLTAEELKWIIAGYTAGSVPDYQMSAFLMAVFLNGFADFELAPWTEAMLHSGDVLEFDHVGRPKVDKHSTGGVGDKISIPLAPIVAACGLAIPMMSGRGLGHTGGTLDKLESIPGFRVELDPDEFTSILEQLGIVLAGQSVTLVPADRKIYALRDATGTVESIPLISSSIMSKKLAEDLDGLVLDVKVGTGAFMKHLDPARELARTMVGIGAAHGTRVSAILTDMDQPLGDEIGNANELQESIDVLRGEGPADVTELTFRLGVEMLILGGITDDADDARDRLEEAVDAGHALDVFAKVIEAQGGDPGVIEDRSILDRAPLRHEIRAPRSGFVRRCDAFEIGVASVRLGGGRARKEDDVDAGVGITLAAKRGAEVAEGDVLATISNERGTSTRKRCPRSRWCWTKYGEPEPQSGEEPSMNYDEVSAAAATVAEATGRASHQVAVVLGSGLSSYAASLPDGIEVSYDDIPGFPVPKVEGHAGSLFSASVGSNGHAALLFAGRVHTYEGWEMDEVVFGVRTAALAGCHTVLLTNAAGGVGEGLVPGDLVAIRDHINFTGRNPLLGTNDERFGPRFPDMTNTYHPDVRSIIAGLAADQGLAYKEGVYAWFLGPTYETPAEVQMAKRLGADLVGMSTVPEAIALNHMGVRVGGISLVTNLAAGISETPLSHEEVTETAAEARQRFAGLVDALLPRLAAGD